MAERSPLFVSWNIKYTTHTKGHYGIEDPELKFSKKGAQKDSDERTKVQRHKSVKMAWE